MGYPDYDINCRNCAEPHEDCTCCQEAAPPTKQRKSPATYLSPRRVEVLRLIHLRNREIAERLYISVSAVESHLAKLMEVFGVTTRVALALKAVESGWIKVGEEAQ